MGLTEPQAKVLGVLAALGPYGTLTVRELCNETGCSAPRIRGVVNLLTYDGLALRGRRTPAEYQITGSGRNLLNDPRYRDYLPRPNEVAL
ncbi:hypothetical protein [Nocardia sp. R6R-6]|uniref:hypothetical protein n=1 Tax=Nocardia sp. R6R-6 TaxID=3459303 RepID=UPI00403D57E5